MLANMSQSNAGLAAAGGQDPLAGALQNAQDGTKNPDEQVSLALPFPSKLPLSGTQSPSKTPS